MEQTMIDSKTKFIEWFCKEHDKELKNRFLRKMFLDLLEERPGAVLLVIDEEIESSVRRYQRETGNVNFKPDPNENDQLCNEVLEALEKHFLPEKQANEN